MTWTRISTLDDITFGSLIRINHQKCVMLDTRRFVVFKHHAYHESSYKINWDEDVVEVWYDYEIFKAVHISREHTGVLLLLDAMSGLSKPSIYVTP